MSYEDEVIRKLRSQGDPDRLRRRHYLKMGLAGGMTGVCFGLFALGVLGEGRTSRAGLKASSKEEAVKRLAAVSGPELGALALGGVSAIWLLVLTLRLHRLE